MSKTSGLKPFQPGNPGGPGRPKGSRNKLGEAFIEALHESFQQHGAETIERVRIEEPAQYVRVIASLMPKEVKFDGRGLSDISDALLSDLLDAIGRSGDAEGQAGSGGKPSREASEFH